MKIPSEAVSRAITCYRKWPGAAAIDDVVRSSPGVSLYLAGGALRDAVLGIEGRSRDYDLWVKGSVDGRFLDRLRSHGEVESGPFGSPRFYPEGRHQVYADLIPVDQFNNGLWRCDDIVDVLNQFDFTANALALDLQSKQFFNPQNGLRDIDNRTMRAVRFDYPDELFNPSSPLTRNAVLWFRLIHYAAALNFTVEPITAQWIHRYRGFGRYLNDFEALFFPVHNSARGEWTGDG